MKAISDIVNPSNKRQVIETVAYFTIHVLLIAFGCVECMIATNSHLVATIIAAVIFIALASFEHLYGPLIGYDHQGFTAASLSYAFGQFINWIWYACFPQDFEGLTTTIPLAIMFAVIGFILQCLMVWEDVKD